MDVKTTFLNGDIDEMIYMVKPENFVLNDSKSMVCKVNLWPQIGFLSMVSQIPSSHYLINIKCRMPTRSRQRLVRFGLDRDESDTVSTKDRLKPNRVGLTRFRMDATELD
ncbi:hypothetical protein CR513_42559, partial [Mucuna pruriens]